MTCIKAVILSAGVGSRIRPLTDDRPKTLLTIGGIPILERMLTNIRASGIDEIVIVVGYLHEQIQTFVRNKFPELDIRFVINNRYRETNTGYSLMIAEELIAGFPFVKFDGDVVFELEVLQRLLDSDKANCLSIDRNIALDSEEVKVILTGDSRILRVSKTIAPASAIGESIGIEKIDAETGNLLFAELRTMMRSDNNLRQYYEGAYERLIANDIDFHAVDITALNWTEIDTRQDYDTAERIFGNSDK